MKNLIRKILAMLILATTILLSCQKNTDNQNNNICHNAYFKLKDSLPESDRKLFFDEIYKLADIEGVIDFKVVKETSPKNKFEYGATMQFKDQQAYDAYNQNPLHQKFVNEIWLKMVDGFIEIDYMQSKVKE
ncbi:MAG: Dabb family protein [Bacteroidales bacterium]